MSIKSLKDFYQFIGLNPAIRSELDKQPDQASFFKRMVQLGAENGFSFTSDELATAIADAQSQGDENPLTDDQLSAVAGGARSVAVRGNETSCQLSSRWLDPFCTDPT